MKSGNFEGIEFYQHSNSEALSIRISSGDCGENVPLFEDVNGTITILCTNESATRTVRGAFLYAIRVLDKQLND